MRINGYANLDKATNIRYERSLYNRGIPKARVHNVRSESNINLNSSRREAAIYNALGKSARYLGHTSPYGDSLNSFKQILQRRLGYEDNLSMRKVTESKPEVKVKRVVNVKEEDYRRIYNSSINGPLASHVKERGVYENKRYIVLDNVRYESEISDQKRLKSQNFSWKSR